MSPDGLNESEGPLDANDVPASGALGAPDRAEQPATGNAATQKRQPERRRRRARRAAPAPAADEPNVDPAAPDERDLGEPPGVGCVAVVVQWIFVIGRLVLGLVVVFFVLVRVTDALGPEPQVFEPQAPTDFESPELPEPSLPGSGTADDGEVVASLESCTNVNDSADVLAVGTLENPDPAEAEYRVDVVALDPAGAEIGSGSTTWLVGGSQSTDWLVSFAASGTLSICTVSATQLG